jgi:hypothetical protein
MSFSCKNYNYDDDKCRKLKAECIPRRRGCVLEGRIKVSEKLAEKLAKLEESSGEEPGGS